MVVVGSRGLGRKEAAARVGGALEGRPRGFAHGRQERRDFLLISSLIRLIISSPYIERFDFAPKQATNKP